MAEKRRLMMYSSDPYGLGHLARCLKLARACQAVNDDLSTLVVTGSPIADRRSPPAGVELRPLPAITRVGTTRVSRDPRYTLEEVIESRKQTLVNAAREFQPDVLLVDSSPFGANREILETVAFLKEGGKTSLLLGLRDILNAPDLITQDWREQGYVSFIEENYDAVFFFSDQQFFDSISAYHFGDVIGTKTQFAGFISEPIQPPSPESVSVFPGLSGPRILLTLGGGEEGAPIIEAFLDMISRHHSEIGGNIVIISGPLLSTEHRDRLAARAEELGVHFEHFVQDVTVYMRQADVVIASGGYNTVTEVLANAPRALLLPYASHRTEQTLRASLLRDAGLVDSLPTNEVTPEALFERVTACLALSSDPLTEGRERGVLAMNGAENFARALRPFLDRYQT